MSGNRKYEIKISISHFLFPEIGYRKEKNSYSYYISNIKSQFPISYQENYWNENLWTSEEHISRRLYKFKPADVGIEFVKRNA